MQRRVGGSSRETQVIQRHARDVERGERDAGVEPKARYARTDDSGQRSEIIQIAGAPPEDVDEPRLSAAVHRVGFVEHEPAALKQAGVQTIFDRLAGVQRRELWPQDRAGRAGRRRRRSPRRRRATRAPRRRRLRPEARWP